MGSPAFEQRRSAQRAQVRRAVLDATESLLLEAGEEQFSIRRLVERCGYTAPTIYHHFGDKKGLIDALLDRGELADYHLAHAARAELCRRLGRTADARAAYERALGLAGQAPEKRFLEQRLRELAI